MKHLKNYTKFKESVNESNFKVNEGKDDFVARHSGTNITLKKGYKHHTEEELYKLYDKIGELVKDDLKVKNVTVVFEKNGEYLNEGMNDSFEIEDWGYVEADGEDEAYVEVNYKRSERQHGSKSVLRKDLEYSERTGKMSEIIEYIVDQMDLNGFTVDTKKFKRELKKRVNSKKGYMTVPLL